MNEAMPALLEQFPQGAIQIQSGTILSVNAAAKEYFPALACGAPLPDALAPLLGEQNATGTFSLPSGVFFFSRTCAQGQTTLLFSPAPQTAVTSQQLSGFLRAYRQYLGEMLQAFQLLSEDARAGDSSALEQRGSAFSRSFHQAFRLMNNLDYLRRAQEGGLDYVPLTLDLAGLGREVERQAGGLLQARGVRLSWTEDCSSLLIPGDPDMLQQMLLGLISNAAKAPGCTAIALRLERRGGRAVLSIANDGQPLTRAQLTRLFQPPAMDAIPRVGEGAGMGLAVVRHMVALHQGTLLMEALPQGGLRCTLSLPAGAVEPRVSVRTPVDRTGGLSPVLVALSDVLPGGVFSLDDLE